MNILKRFWQWLSSPKPDVTAYWEFETDYPFDPFYRLICDEQDVRLTFDTFPELREYAAKRGWVLIP